MTDPDKANVELILYRLNELHDKTTQLVRQVGDLDDKTVTLMVDVARLKVKSGVWGALAGAASAVATAVIAWITTR